MLITNENIIKNMPELATAFLDTPIVFVQDLCLIYFYFQSNLTAIGTTKLTYLKRVDKKYRVCFLHTDEVLAVVDLLKITRRSNASGSIIFREIEYLIEVENSTYKVIIYVMNNNEGKFNSFMGVEKVRDDKYG